MSRLAIVGGGWSGLACAEALLARGHHVELFEAAPALGGRARGLRGGIGSDAPIDVGQHLVIGAYSETLALLSRCGALGWRSGRLRWNPIEQDGRCGLQMADWIALLASLPPLLRKRPTREETVNGWLSRLGLNTALRRRLLEPLAEAALNTETDAASAWVFHRVLLDSARGGIKTLAPWHPARDLSHDAIDPIAEHLARQGLVTHCRARISKIERKSDGLAMRAHPSTSEPSRRVLESGRFDALVLALPAWSAHLLWTESELAPSKESMRWSRVSTRGIATLWVHASSSGQREPLSPWQVNCLARPEGGVFIGMARPAGAWGQVLAVVSSACADPEEGREANMHRSALAWLGPAIMNGAHIKLIRERKATWACTAQAVASGDAWGDPQTGEQGIWRCSDDMVEGYPATIESAVRSGRRTAHALADSLLREESVQGVG